MNTGVAMLIFGFLFLHYGNCYKILGVFPIAGKSHYMLNSKLMKGLAEAGHDVTVISPYKLEALPKNGTYKDIIIEEFEEIFHKSLDINFLQKDTRNINDKISQMTSFFQVMTNATLHHPKVKALLQSNKKFDAVIIEHFFNDAHKIFAHIYQCPLINLVALGPKGWINSVVGNTLPISYVPHMFLPGDHTKGMTFFQRMRNLLYYVLDYFCNRYYHMPIQEEILRSAFPDAPSMWEIHSNVSIVLLNSHSSIYQPMPMVPNMIEIGGYHIDPPQNLPEDVQRFLDSATDGVIYFSLGSNIKDHHIVKERLDIFRKVFGRLKQHVLWKFANDSMVFTKNVLVKRWFPQQDILAHPNVRLFITHAGQLSLTEAVYHAVPILAIPIFCDQPMNAQLAFRNGFGLTLDYFDDENFNEETLSNLINELLKNPKYKQNAQRVSKIFHDRPLKPMRSAVYWVEYAIRHNGAEHLRVDGINQPWYKYFMIDVIVFLLVFILSALYTASLVYERLLCAYTNRYTNKKKQKMN